MEAEEGRVAKMNVRPTNVHWHSHNREWKKNFGSKTIWSWKKNRKRKIGQFLKKKKEKGSKWKLKKEE